jgi:hypothetical protein
MNWCANETIKDVFIFPFPKILDLNLTQSIILGFIKMLV